MPRRRCQHHWKLGPGIATTGVCTLCGRGVNAIMMPARQVMMPEVVGRQARLTRRS